MEKNPKIEINNSKIWGLFKNIKILHNHLEKEFDIFISIAKHKFKEFKEEIRKSSVPFDITQKYMKVCNIQNFKYNNFSISTLILIYADGMLSVAPKFNIVFSHIKKNKNKLCFNEMENNNDLYIYCKYISNFPIINFKYKNDIYDKIKSEFHEHNHKSQMFYKLILSLQEESLSYNDYEKRIGGIFLKKKKQRRL
ncbi:hypothetical protein H8356DRAFT_1343710 [Neocallimastix lanati (nom. inval.)]|nr:hypothetical protein H8356DRAFT_1343710 [Neocallimastix sp. JGI-2020a]